MNPLLLVVLILAASVTACGTDEADREVQAPAAEVQEEPTESTVAPKPMCKTDTDGTVYRIETDANAIDLRESLAKMGFRACR
jgi:hypothetical protein